jgi:hypothetical protein
MIDRNYWIRQLAIAAHDSAYSHLQATREGRATEAGALHCFNSSLAVVRAATCTERELELLIEQRAMPIYGMVSDTRGLPPEHVVRVATQFAEGPQFELGKTVAEQPR